MPGRQKATGDRDSIFQPSFLIAALVALACRAVPVVVDGDPVLLTLGDQNVRRSDFERHVAAVEARGGGRSIRRCGRPCWSRTSRSGCSCSRRVRAGWSTLGDGQEKENEAVRQLLAESRPARVTVTEAEVDAHCREHAHDFDEPERVRLQQILVPTSNEARDVVRRLKKDPRSFTALAQSRSRGPEASTGGAMGVFCRGQLPAELETAAFALAAGETSDVVASPLGYHVLRVEARTAAREAGLRGVPAGARADASPPQIGRSACASSSRASWPAPR